MHGRDWLRSLSDLSPLCEIARHVFHRRSSGNVLCPEVVSREHLATLLLSGVENALRFSANLFGPLSAQ